MATTIWASLIIQKKEFEEEDQEKNGFRRGKKVAFLCSQKDKWYIIFFNFTDRRCLCVGNAGRSEVPNRNSICIPSVSKINVDKILCAVQKKNCLDFLYPTSHRAAQQFCMQSFLPEKMSDCQIGFSTPLEIFKKKVARNFYLKKT